MLYIIRKKVLKKIKEFQSNSSFVRFYHDNKAVIYIDLSHRTKVRTYLNLFLRIRDVYKEPIVIKFSIIKMIFLAKWFKELDYIYFAQPTYKLNKLKTFTHSKKGDFIVNFKYKKVYSTNQYQKDVLPYIMHPSNYLQNDIEKLPKNIGILMSGNFEKKIYDTEIIPYNFGLLNRWKIYEEVNKHQKLVSITGTELVERLNSGEFKNVLVLMKWQTGAIPTHKWRHYLSSADFLFCAPGMTMPMCHNILEAMSVGVIPILNYPHWLNPSLEDNQNCLVYCTVSDIKEIINKALSLSSDEKSDMSKRVMEYYTKYYASFSFSEDSNNELVILNENLSDLI